MYELKLPDTAYASGLRQEKEDFQYTHVHSRNTQSLILAGGRTGFTE